MEHPNHISTRLLSVGFFFLTENQPWAYKSPMGPSPCWLVFASSPFLHSQLFVQSAIKSPPLPRRRNLFSQGCKILRQVQPSWSPNQVVGACISSTINRVIQVQFLITQRTFTDLWSRPQFYRKYSLYLGMHGPSVPLNHYLEFRKPTK